MPELDYFPNEILENISLTVIYSDDMMKSRIVNLVAKNFFSCLYIRVSKQNIGLRALLQKCLHNRDIPVLSYSNFTPSLISIFEVHKRLNIEVSEF